MKELNLKLKFDFSQKKIDKVVVSSDQKNIAILYSITGINEKENEKFFIEIKDIKKNSIVSTVNLFSNSTHHILFLDNDILLVTGYENIYTLTKIFLKSGSIYKGKDKNNLNLKSIRYNKAKKTILSTADTYNSIECWDSNTLSFSTSFTGIYYDIVDIAVSKDGKIVSTVEDYDGEHLLKVWFLQDQFGFAVDIPDQKEGENRVIYSDIISMAFTDDNKYLFTATKNNIFVYRVSKKQIDLKQKYSLDYPINKMCLAKKNTVFLFSLNHIVIIDFNKKSKVVYNHPLKDEMINDIQVLDNRLMFSSDDKIWFYEYKI